MMTTMAAVYMDGPDGSTNLIGFIESFSGMTGWQYSAPLTLAGTKHKRSSLERTLYKEHI